MIERIFSPDDLKRLGDEDRKRLADEIRCKLIDSVSENGGHLASNLGAVEMTIALHCAFNAPHDKIFFDVGHQAYTHKILTGRADRMNTLRKKDGLSGFPRREESVYDPANAGHASDAISLALGAARARDLKGEDAHVIAVVGDGALTGGMCYEALNDAGQSSTRLIVVLNDNEMSISKNVGAMSAHLTQMRQSSFYRKMKQKVRALLERMPGCGDKLAKVLIRIRDSIKSLLISDSFFDALGIEYLGPIDGHDIEGMIRVFEKAKDSEKPVVIHVVTQKGRGYQHAEERPDRFHGIAPFFVDSGKARNQGGMSAGGIAVSHLIQRAKEEASIVCVSAAMLDGTGLKAFQKEFPERCFDVGIAEEHAVSMAAGMALGGLKPFVAIYSTFLQRAYDQVMMDACLNKAPVTLLIDRAGLNGADGETHQGIYDISYLRAVPDIIVACPADSAELTRMIDLSLLVDSVMAIRYPKEIQEKSDRATFEIGQWDEVAHGSDAVILAGGRMLSIALDAAKKLHDAGILAAVVNARFIKPMDESVLSRILSDNIPVFTLEDGVRAGGFGEGVLSWIQENGGKNRVTIIGAADRFIAHASVSQQTEELHMDACSVLNRVIEVLEEEKHAASR